METVNVRIPMGLSVVLSEVVNSILNEVDANGKVSPRKLPFRLAYRLTRNKTSLDRDVKVFEEKKMVLIAKYGDITADGNNVEITDPHKLSMYSREVNALIDTVIEHSLIPVDKEDIDKITADIPMSSEALKLFIGYMTADEELYKDLEKEIHFKEPDFSGLEPKTEKPVEAKPAKEEEKPKKATTKSPAKKTTTKKESTTASDEAKEAPKTKKKASKPRAKKTE